MRAHLDMNADDRLAEMAGGVKAGVAEIEAELIFTLGAEAAVAFVAGGIFRVLVLFANVNSGMDFERDHCKLP